MSLREGELSGGGEYVRGGNVLHSFSVGISRRELGVGGQKRGAEGGKIDRRRGEGNMEGVSPSPANQRVWGAS